MTVENAVSDAVQTDGVAGDAGGLAAADIPHDIVHIGGRQISGAEKFAEHVAFRIEPGARLLFQKRIQRQERIEIIRRDFGFDIEKMIARRCPRTAQNVLVVRGDRAERTQDEPFVPFFVFLGEDVHDFFHHLVRRIAIRIGVVDHRIVRFGQGQNHAAEFRDHAENIVDLIAQEFLEIRAEQIEFAVAVEQGGPVLEHALGHHDLAVPQIDRLADGVGDIDDLPQRLSGPHDHILVAQGGGSWVGFQQQLAVQSAGRMRERSAQLEAVHVIPRRFGRDPPHVGAVDRSRMHQTPGDFLFHTHSSLFSCSSRIGSAFHPQ